MGSEHLDFVVLDFETANANLSSICQVGIAGFGDRKLLSCFETLIDPEDYFDCINIAIHGITEKMVAGSPRWPDVYPSVASLLSGRIVVSHTPFDRVALQRVCEKYEAQEIRCIWLDSARVVRRTWDCFARSGYGLSNLASHFGIEYRAHNALEDARCAGQIVVHAMEQSGLGLQEWLKRVNLPIHAAHMLSAYEPNADGPLFGEVLVFTGSLTITRHEAAAIAAEAGCKIDVGVTKHTTILVVGDEDVTRLAGYEKSSKHRKAEGLILKGQRIRILTETDFKKIIANREPTGATLGGFPAKQPRPPAAPRA